jgi:clan AA aspartic protease
MGLVFANIELVNANDEALAENFHIGEDEIRRMTINVMVDSGAITLAINEEIRVALGLKIKSYRPSLMADGRRTDLPVVGPIKVVFEGRDCNTDALVLPDDNEPLLGAIPMEAMDLWINPARNLLTGVHPEGPVWSLR